MSKTFINLFLLLIATVLSADVVASQAKLIPNTLNSGINLSPYLSIFVDNSRKINSNKVLNGIYESEFISLKKTGNNLGFTQAIVWVKFTLPKQKETNQKFVLEFDSALTDYVDLFFKNSDGTIIRYESGDSIAFSNRAIEYRNPIFILNSPETSPQTYYLRLQTNGAMQIDLSLWSLKGFLEFIDKNNLLQGLYYGLMLALVLISIVSFINIHDRVFLYFSLYLASFVLLQMSLNGFSFQYLWPNTEDFTSRLTSMIVAVVAMTAILFASHFLNIWSQSNKTPKIMLLTLFSLASFGAIFSIFGSYEIGVKLSAVSGVLLPPVILMTAILSIKDDYKRAYFFLLAWTIFLVGAFTSGLLHLGMLPYNFFTVHSMQVGSLFMALFLGYALMDRINLLRQEKDSAKEDANNYLSQLNEKLEAQVQQRTTKLKESNQKLKQLSVQDSMTGLLNHKAITNDLIKLEKTTTKYQSNLAVIMLDIDFFKSINDNYGHPAGDMVIKATANVLINYTRDSDKVGRYGGEEFMIILPDTGKRKATELARRIKEKISDLRIPEINSEIFTASFGISTLDKKNKHQKLVSEADSALYKAKKAGRNKIVVFENTSKETSGNEY